jgi:hypothetical protein
MTTFTKERVKWLHDAATELASTKMKMTMKPAEVLQLTTALLASLEAKPVAWTDEEELRSGDNEVWMWKAPHGFGRDIPLYAAPPSPVIPDGYALVPIEPTENMVIDGFESKPDSFFSAPDEWAAYEAMSGCQQAAHKARLCWGQCSQPHRSLSDFQESV